MPIFIGIQWPSAREAKECSRGDLSLAFCSSCGFIWNDAFDPELLEYGHEYDNALEFSAVFRDFEESLIRRLINRYDLHDKDIIDIGCGKGHFLARLCEVGGNRGLGFDPSYQGEWDATGGRVTYIRDLYCEKYSGRAADMICCRQVLEHIGDPVAFLCMIRRAIGSRESTFAYFEVPNIALTLRNCSPWDIIYEHCSYFTAGSLSQLFSRSGFEVLALDEVYQGQFLGIDVRILTHGIQREATRNGELDDLRGTVENFATSFTATFRIWRQRLSDWQRAGAKVIAWGAGARAVGFLNMLKISSELPYVVDINPRKHGLFLAGTGQEIVGPEFLAKYRPDVVVLMNPIYRSEIADQLRSMNIAADLVDAF